MPQPVNTDLWIKCHKKSSYRKICKLMNDENFRGQFDDKLMNMIEECACDKHDLVIAIISIEESKEDSDAEGALRIAEKLTTMFQDTMAIVSVHDNHGIWRETYKEGRGIFKERCTKSYYSDGEFRADNKQALYDIGNDEDDVWQEWVNFQPDIEGTEIAPEYRDDWEELAELSDLAEGEELKMPLTD